MKFDLSKDLKCGITALLALGVSAIPGLAQAEADWGSFTLDNDTFIGEDQGYTNGLYYSWYDTPANNKAKPGFLARAMLWSLADADGPLTLSAKTIGQTMSTPEDITIPNPPLDDLPYAGLLFYSDNFISVHDSYADKIGVTIGVVWVVYDMVRLGAKIPKEAKLTHQERAYTSPIWYDPAGK
jgi:hypothetical protein